jgi:hypothetical protein
MTHYESSTPRAACGIAAVAMAALTFALMVGLPAVSGPDAAPVHAIAAPEPAALVTRSADVPAPTGARTDCERPDSMQARSVLPPRAQQS